MGVDHRRFDRYRVHLSVRFSRAQDFVVQYADNLSAGGLFVRGAHDLEPLSEVVVDLDLPAGGTHRVRARVAHVLDPATAERLGRTPGAGLELIATPPGFQASLLDYLARLGKRRDAAVLTQERLTAAEIADAGFQARAAEPPAAAAEVASDPAIVAVVVGPERAGAYRAALGARSDLVVVRGEDRSFADLLLELDRRAGVA